MRYLYSESDGPIASDYYYEARHTTNNSFPFVPAHTHDYYEIYIYLGGSVRLSVEDTLYELKKGDIVIIPPYTIHQLFQAEPKTLPYIRMYMYITETALKSFQFNEHNPLNKLRLASKHKRYHFHIENEDHFNAITYCMRQIYDSQNCDFYGKEMLNRAHILKIITLLNMNIVEALEPQGIVQLNPLVEQLLAYINSNYVEEISLDLLAEKFYLNKSTLSKEFKDYTAQTIHNYLVMKRISIAKQEMANGVSPSQVYLSIGFRDYSTFYRTFQRTEGISPKEFFSRVSSESN
ncbi:MAG: helix-turn-helix domain-containing protein [Lachnospiraceae bacterium]|nr:helix-turn-helix domain-containing protein [Lachnospiraceae bacterium]